MTTCVQEQIAKQRAAITTQRAKAVQQMAWSYSLLTEQWFNSFRLEARIEISWRWCSSPAH